MADLTTDLTTDSTTETNSSASCCASERDAVETALTPSLPLADRRIELYEPAMCCDTGVCGPAVDQRLIDVREDLRWAASQGAAIARHNLTSDPDAFVANAKVTGLMAAFGDAALPAVVVDGEIALHGRYPSRQELTGLLSGAAAPAQAPTGGCGCGPGGC